jgi:hypothetical protein
MPPAPWRRAGAFSLAALALMTAEAARADAPEDDDGEVCADRPGKAYDNCTTPKGVFQVETDLYDQSFRTTPDRRTTLTYYSNPTLKYGLADGIDVQLAMPPWMSRRSTDRATGRSVVRRGNGDLTLQAKFAVSETATLMPFITAPTAPDSLGAPGWAGGLRAPIQFPLPGKGWTLTLTPELDATPNQTGAGAHLTHVQVIGINKDVGRGVSLGAELWGQWDYDPSGTTRQASFDLTAAWIPPKLKSLQIDAQLYLGLTGATPDAQWIVGVSKRF